MSEDLSKIPKEKLLRFLLEDKSENPPDIVGLVQKLKALFKRFSEKEKFKPGDLVVWKQGLKNKKMPPYNVPAIVIECLDEPIIADISESGSAYFREPLDLITGIIDSDGEFIVFHFDSRRFEKYEGD